MMCRVWKSATCNAISASAPSAWRALGARVTGVDFSPVSLAKAADLANRCQVELSLVEADACDPPSSLSGRFDLVYATIGVLCWIEDLGSWMGAVAGLLHRGGHLVLIDFHPLVTMIDTLEPLVFDLPYNFDGPHRFDQDGSYTDRSAHLEGTTTVQYAHGMGEIVTATISAVSKSTFLRSALPHPATHAGHKPQTAMAGRAGLGGQLVPHLYTLLARKPPVPAS